MGKRIFSLLTFSVILLSSLIPVGLSHNAGFPSAYDSKTLFIDTYGEPMSVDPAWAYDMISGEVIMNIYETLVAYKTNWELGPYHSWQADSFVPVLATSVPHMEFTDLPAGKVEKMTFTIRNGVTFSDGNPLTATDVEYSFERMLVQDRDEGPQWSVYHALLGVYRAVDPTSDANFGDKINNAIVSSSNTVTFYFNLAVPERMWLQTLAQTWGSVVEKSWAVGLGDFDGDWSHGWQYIWNMWHNPYSSFIENQMMGSGPYKLNYLYGHELTYSITKNPLYWQGWPATVIFGDIGGERVTSSIDTIVWNYQYYGSTHRTRLFSGISDLGYQDYFDRQYRDQFLAQPGMNAFYPLTTFSVYAFFFNFNVNPLSPFTGQTQPPGTFAENGIPPNLFSDVNVRKGFAYAFDYDSFITQAYLGEGEQPSDPIVKGILYDNPAQEKYVFDLSKATYYLKLAWGGVDANGNGIIDPVNELGDVEGALWTNGMTFYIWHSGGVTNQVGFEIIVKNINSLNPKFHLYAVRNPTGWIIPKDWMPMFFLGYSPDYPDADSCIFDFMHSQGVFPILQSYNNSYVDSLILAGETTPDGPARQQIYYELQAIYHDDVPSVPIYLPLGRDFQRDWVKGWHYNPILLGNDFYHMWKAKTHFGGANNDGTVDVRDLAYVSSHWTAAGRPYNPAADLNGGKGGLTGTEYIRGMPDGVIDIADIGLISAYWDGPPQGIAHP